MSKYDDIINLNRPKSRYPKMSMLDRASQFAPFAALTIHGEEVRETTRLTDKKIELSDEQIDDINIKLQYIANNIKTNSFVKITYFIKDKVKDGGKYVTVKNNVKKIDSYNKKIYLENNIKISFEDIIYIDI